MYVCFVWVHVGTPTGTCQLPGCCCFPRLSCPNLPVRALASLLFTIRQGTNQFSFDTWIRTANCYFHHGKIQATLVRAFVWCGVKTVLCSMVPAEVTRSGDRSRRHCCVSFRHASRTSPASLHYSCLPYDCLLCRYRIDAWLLCCVVGLLARCIHYQFALISAILDFCAILYVPTRQGDRYLCSDAL